MLALTLTANAAGPAFDIIEFTDNLDGTATLRIRCLANKRVVQFTVKRKDLDKLDVDGIFALIQKECNDPNNMAAK